MLFNKDNMTMILKDDIDKILRNYNSRIYDNVRNNDLENINLLIIESLKELNDYYELNNKEDNLSVSKIKYLNNYTNQYFEDKINDYRLRIKHRENIKDKLLKLKELKLPEQRSEEWYAIREGILTASSLADAIGEGHFCTRDKLLIQKCGGERGDVPFEIVEWGVMYEPVATTFYEKINNLKVLEFGLVPHPSFKIFGASPDGICDEDSPEEYVGRMLEIKCPPKRQFTNEVPKHYWMQMQGQLESCDLEECDFLQVKFMEYFSENDYIEDLYLENSIVKEGYSSNNLPKGLLIAFIRNNLEGNPTIKYEYSEFYSSYNDLKNWSNKILNNYKNSEFKYNNIKFHWWRIERYECTLVGRDRKWWLETEPKIIDFWEDVEHYRKVGIQEFHNKKQESRIKKIKIKKDKEEKKSKKQIFDIDKSVVEKLKNDYMIDSDSD